MAINLCHQFSTHQRFLFSETKTKILCYETNSKSNLKSPWNLNKNPLEVVKQQEHLGIIRRSDQPRYSMEDVRVQDGRRAAYSLFGAGFHGLNGLNPKTSIRIWKVFIIPRLIHGLEVIVYDEKKVELIENYQRATLKQLQHLPSGCSNSATYLIAGVSPIKAEIEKRTLTTFVRFIRDQSSAEFQIIKRQIAIKGLDSKSWTVHVRKLLHKFKLPSAYELLENPPSKEIWKQSVKKAINCYYEKALVQEVIHQSSMKFLNISSCSLSKCHPVWNTIKPSSRDVTRGMLKAKLLTGTYNLEGKRAKFKNVSNSGLCPLCQKDVETREHFIAICPMLTETREKYLKEFKSALLKCHSIIATNAIFSSTITLTKAVLDPSFCSYDTDHNIQLEEITRRLCYALHCRRSCLILPPDSTRVPASAAAYLLAETRVCLIQAEATTTR